MDDVQICRAAASDQPQLHRIWQEVFGYPTDLILAFYDCFPPEASAWTVRRDDHILSAAYLIPGNWYLNGAEVRPAGYVYAVATPEEHRGQGYAGLLMRALAKEAEAREMLLYTRPAEPSLFPWYAKTMSAANAGRMSETIIDRDAAAALLPCRTLTPEEYGARREALLKDTPHIVFSERFLKLQEIYSDGFYAVGDSLCCCAGQENSLLISEYLGAAESAFPTAQTMMERLGKGSAILRLEHAEGAMPSAAFCGSGLRPDTHWGMFLE